MQRIHLTWLLLLSFGLFLDAQEECHHGDIVDTVCECDSDYYGDTCDYQKRKQSLAFVASLFGGFFGADWFYLSRGDAVWIIIGVFKCLCTLGFISGFLTIKYTELAGSKYNWVITICIMACIVCLPVTLIWWLVDWIRLASNECQFPDGNDICLQKW